MFARLYQIFLRQGRNELVLSLLKTHAVQRERPLVHLVQSRRLVRVFAVAQAFFLSIDTPGLLGVSDDLISDGQRQFGRKGITIQSMIHFFEIAHIFPGKEVAAKVQALSTGDTGQQMPWRKAILRHVQSGRPEKMRQK